MSQKRHRESLMNFLRENFLLFIVFITGAAVLVIEVTATRILAPYFGNTLFTISSIIGVILGALSLGYYLGGVLADRHPRLSVFFLLILAAGLFSLLIQLFSEISLPLLGGMLGMKAGPPVASLILFFVPSLLLGMMSPFAIKLKARELKKIGKVSGNVFFWSTLGSIAGSFLTGFFLIPHWGVSRIIFYTGILLIIIGLFGGWLTRKNPAKNRFQIFSLFLIIVVFAFSSVTLFRSLPKSILYQKDGLYSQITIENIQWQGEEARFLYLDRSAEGGIFLESDELPFAYTQYYSLYKIVNPQAETALFLGGGAYSNPRKILLEKNNIQRVDVVEIEPVLYSLAQQYFKLPVETRLFNHFTDGRRYLQETSQQYDIIFADVYSSIYSIPIHFTTQEFFVLAESRLEENGLFLMNIIGCLEGKGSLLLRSEMKTFLSVFENSYLFPVACLDEQALQNYILLGLKNGSPVIDWSGEQKKPINPRGLNLDSAFILTDDFAPVEYLTAQFFH